jgi:hypothetical protein
MPYKDAEKQKEYQRQYQRNRRAGKPSSITLNRTSSPEEIKTASALLFVLSNLIKEVLDTDKGDVFLRARTAGYLISIGLKAVETADLEARLTKLEARSK